MQGPPHKGPPIAADFTEEELTGYNVDYKSPEYTSLMGTVMRYHTAASRRRKAAKFRMPKKRYQRPPLTFEEMIPDALKEYFHTNQFNSQREFLKKLGRFGIPSEPQMVRYLDYENEQKSTLGDRIWMFESPVLKALTPVNMSHRYRGMPRSCNATKTIDILQLEDESDEDIWYEERQSKLGEEYLKTKPFNYLLKASKDKDHFRFIKSLTKAQLMTIPLSILETCMEDVYPTFETVFNIYCSYVREDHDKPKEVLAHRARIHERMELFKRM